MITITNSKVAGFAPVWAPYRGFSLLFDNPGKNFAATPGLLKIDCVVALEPDLLLYNVFDKLLRKIGHDVLTNTYLFCPLPPRSYHVTVWDGINDGNVSSVISYHRDELKRFLQDLPDSLHRFPKALAFILKSSLLGRAYGTIGFKFKKLSLWGNQVLVARLEPASEDSKNRLAHIVEARKDRTDQLFDQLGVKASHGFSPHVSLGYFANRESAELAKSSVERWTQQFVKDTQGLTISFSSISLYGFTDMVSFFKRDDPDDENLSEAEKTVA